MRSLLLIAGLALFACSQESGVNSADNAGGEANVSEKGIAIEVNPNKNASKPKTLQNTIQTPNANPNKETANPKTIQNKSKHQMCGTFWAPDTSAVGFRSCVFGFCVGPWQKHICAADSSSTFLFCFAGSRLQSRAA